MKVRNIIGASFIFMFVFVALASAATITLESSSLEINVGDSFYVNIGISGLGNGVDPSLGAFSTNINYDPTIISFTAIDYGNYLGDIDIEADTWCYESIPGVLYVDEISFLGTEELNTLQPDNFILATLSFTAITFGQSGLSCNEIVLSDAYAFEIPANAISSNVNVNPVPVPASFLFFGSGIIVMMLRKKIFF